MDKKQQLEKLKEEMLTDKSLPLRNQATNLVFGEGDPEAKAYFLGEAPGYWEDKQGRPFVGSAGKFLDELLQNIGFKRKDVYISNVVRFRPPENRDPFPSEIAAFASYVDKEIGIIKPVLIVTLGRYSMGKFLPNEKISKVHGKPLQINWQGQDMTILPMYHPAAALRKEEIMDQLKEDFKKIPQLLEKLTAQKTEQLSLI